MGPSGINSPGPFALWPIPSSLPLPTSCSSFSIRHSFNLTLTNFDKPDQKHRSQIFFSPHHHRAQASTITTEISTTTMQSFFFLVLFGLGLTAMAAPVAFSADDLLPEVSLARAAEGFEKGGLHPGTLEKRGELSVSDEHDGLDRKEAASPDRHPGNLIRGEYDSGSERRLGTGPSD